MVRFRECEQVERDGSWWGLVTVAPPACMVCLPDSFTLTRFAGGATLQAVPPRRRTTG